MIPDKSKCPSGCVPYISKSGSPHWEQKFFTFQSSGHGQYGYQKLDNAIYILKERYAKIQKHRITCELVWPDDQLLDDRYYRILLWKSPKFAIIITDFVNPHNILNTGYMDAILKSGGLAP